MGGTLAAIAVGLVWAGGYVVACAIWPFGDCSRCGGSGKRRSPSGRAFRRCPKCSGTGARLRVGNRIYNYFRGNR